MKNKLFFLILKIGIASILLLGVFLILASLLPYEALASLLNRLAADGQLELFTLSLYQAINLPLGLNGAFLVIVAGLILFRWGKVTVWLQALPIQARNFLSLLRRDTKDFFEDASHTIKDLRPGGIAALISLMLVALVLRLGNLDLPLAHDEAYTYNAFASRSLWHIVTDYHLPNNHVFLSILIHFTTRLLGDHIWAIRLPSILAGVFIAPATFWLAKRLYSLETAFLGAALVAVFPVLIKYSVYARGYTIVCLFTLLILSLGDYVRVKQNRFAWMLIVILSALGFFTVPIMFFPFGGLYVWLFGAWVLGNVISYESRWTFLKYWLISGFSAAFITVVLYLPIIVKNADRFFGNGFVAPVPWDIFPETLWSRLRNTWLEWTFSVPNWLVAICVVGFIISLILHWKFSRRKFPLQFAMILWIIILLILRRPDMLPRFWLFLAAPVLVWAAAGVVELLRKIPVKIGKGWNLAQVSVSAVIIVALAYSAWTIPALVVSGQEDEVKSATIYLKDILGESDLVTASIANLPALRYYFNFYGVPRGTIRRAGNFQRAFIIVDRQKGETLEYVVPKMGFDLPVIDMDSAKVLVQFDFITIYEGYPAQ